MTLAVVALVSVPLLIASLAFACARLAVVKLDRASARPGDTVTIVGRNFNAGSTASPVAVRFNSRSGRVLWEGRANRSGRFTATFEAPRAARGDYVIVATQTLADGRPAAGTPGRAPLRMRAAAKSSRRNASAAPFAPVGAPQPPTGPPGALLVGATLAALLAGGAVLATSRRGRTTA